METAASRNTATNALVSISTFALTAFILILARLKAPFTILLADRLLPGSGWVEITILCLYASFLASKMVSRKDNRRLRLTIWLVFSVVFFAQFIIGVAGVDMFLMTGKLHVPVPAVVIGGPIFRGERFFMPIMFISTILLAGPAWCSYLCYVGAWDGLASAKQKRAGHLSAVWIWLRITLFVLTPVTALLLRFLGADGITAGLVAVGFGVVGAGVMAGLSLRRGVMVHCTSVCPLGLASNLLGKVSPFRIRIGKSCTDCGRCHSACRYNALNKEQIEKRRPGYSCTLCGDCLNACPEEAITYGFLGLNGIRSRRLFLVVVVSLHAVFLGVARI